MVQWGNAVTFRKNVVQWGFPELTDPYARFGGYAYKGIFPSSPPLIPWGSPLLSLCPREDRMAHLRLGLYFHEILRAGGTLIQPSSAKEGSCHWCPTPPRRKNADHITPPPVPPPPPRKVQGYLRKRSCQNSGVHPLPSKGPSGSACQGFSPSVAPPPTPPRPLASANTASPSSLTAITTKGMRCARNPVMALGAAGQPPRGGGPCVG